MGNYTCEHSGATFDRPDCWTSVKDKLPEISESVLVTDGMQICIAFIQTEKLRFTQINTWDDWIHDGVTHWMPLPKLPETPK